MVEQFINFKYLNDRRAPNTEVNEPPVARYALDEKFIQELEAEEITKPELKLKHYNWDAHDNDVKVNFRKTFQEQSQYVSTCLILN